MRKSIEQLGKLVADFIEQRDDLMLVVACPPGEAALMLKLLLDQETNRKDDLYYLMAEDFKDGKSYLDAIAGRLQREFNASVESATPDVPALPPVPAVCLSSADPVARLQAVLAYTRSLVPPATGHRIIWGLGPGEIANLADFVALLMGCLPRPNIEPWMRGLRMIVRVAEDFSDKDPLASAPRVRFRRFAIPPNAAEDELRETAQNKQMPNPERMAALLQVSFIDAAHDRLPAATAGFRQALASFQKSNDAGMQALAMIGLADCCRRGKDIDKAKYWYECAIVPAGEAKQIMSLAMIAQHLGAIAYEDKKYEDAVAYFEQLVILKRSIPDEDGLVEALLWRGRAQDKAAQKEAALASWDEAMLVCRTFELEHREEECLAQLQVGAGEKVVAEWRSAKPT